MASIKQPFNIINRLMVKKMIMYTDVEKCKQSAMTPLKIS